MKFLKETLNFENVKESGIIVGKLSPFIFLALKAIGNFYAPIWPMIVFVAIVGIGDVITGVWAAWVEKLPITSEKLYKRKVTTVMLFFIVLTCMLAVDRMLAEIHTSIPAFFMITWMLFYIVYELFSMLENVARINKDLPVRSFINLLKRKSPEDLKDVMEEVDKGKPQNGNNEKNS